MMDKYTVIDKEEPRKQSIAKNGIPCTARYSVTTLNRLMQENYRLSVKVQGINELLNDVKNKFYKSREKEVIPNLDVHIYKCNKPKFHITCDDFYKYIYTQKKIYINDIK